MKFWKNIGFVATLLIVLSIPIYLLINANKPEKELSDAPKYVGRDKCIDCHKKEYEAWKGSDHDKAMDIATDSSVLGNFNNSEFTSRGITSKFYKRDGKFYVYTNGIGGKMYEMEITHTFGHYPLQQYLVPTEKGRYQCLPLAWDSQKNKWFSLVDATYGNDEIAPSDWLYWTNNGQNWNGMCAECHSTNLQKNFDPKTKEYKTTYSEIDVSCEACHGPGSKHVEWAQLPEMARPQNSNFNLITKTSGLTNSEFVELCAYCHSRRSSLNHLEHGKGSMFNNVIPRSLDENYFADGQILEEDYVYGSFTQSKMYDKGIMCNDCHDVHSGKRILEGNALCTQCHQPETYDTKSHHFHKLKGESGSAIKSGDRVFEVGSGSECKNCHMPDRVYMGNDWRNDHSLRVPRPDLTIAIGTPNACNQCHSDKSAKWADNYITKWYGIKRKPHYGIAFADARANKPNAYKELVKILENNLYLPIVRATSLHYLANYISNTEVFDAVTLAMQNEEPFIRYAAVRAFAGNSLDQLLKYLIPLLNDPVKSIRMEAAFKLSAIPKDQFPNGKLALLNDVLFEYKDAMNYQADFAGGRLNLGILYSNLQNFVESEKQYKEALKIDSLFYPAKVNLSVVLNQLGKNDEAEEVLRDLIATHPEYRDSYYSLGLLLAEKKDYDGAVTYLKKASELLPDRPRIFYNLGLILQFQGKNTQAETALLKAAEMAPETIDFIYALADHYIKSKQFAKARKVAKQIKSRFPNQQVGNQLLEYLNNLN